MNNQPQEHERALRAQHRGRSSPRTFSRRTILGATSVTAGICTIPTSTLGEISEDPLGFGEGGYGEDGYGGTDVIRHPSGVEFSVWEAVTGQNGPEDQLTFQDLVDGILAYHGDDEVAGIHLGFQDLIDLILWYQSDETTSSDA